MSSERPHICLVGTHDPGFGRISLMADGLRRHGYRVTTCVEPTWGGTAERVAAARHGLRNPALARRLAASYTRLARRLRSMNPKPDVLLVGYPGQLDVLFLRALLPRARIVLDAFVSIDETLADRSIGSPSSPTRRAARALDRVAFRLADRIIVDTAAHGRRLAVRYGLDLTRTIVVPVGARDPLELAGGLTGERPNPLPPRGGGLGWGGRSPSGALRALYFGGFVPLHGVDVIVQAARRIQPLDGIEIHLVGDGQDAELAERMLAETPLPYVQLLRTWMSEAQLLAEQVSAADVVLGVFAQRSKTMDVVPAKVYLGMACGLPVLTADSPAIREEVIDRVAAEPPPLVTCPAGDPDALARCLLSLRDDPARRRDVGAAGRAAYDARFSPERIVEPLVACVGELGVELRAD